MGSLVTNAVAGFRFFIRKQLIVFIAVGLLTGCAAVKVERNVADNVFYSSYPALNVTVAPEFKYVGNNKFESVGHAFKSTVLLSFKNDYYFFIQSDQNKTIQKYVIMEIKWVETHFRYDRISRVKRKLESGTIKIGRRQYQYYTKTACPKKGRNVKFLAERGYTWPCYLFAAFHRVMGPQRQFLFSVYYGESFENSDFTYQSFKNPDNLSSDQKAYLKDFHQRALAAFNLSGRPIKPQPQSVQTPRKAVTPPKATETKVVPPPKATKTPVQKKKSQPAMVSTPSPPATSAPVISDKKKYKIAVMKFQALNDTSGGGRLGTMVSEMFTTEVVNSDAFKIVEREQLRKIIDELNVGQSGIIDTTEAQKIGKMLGASAIITGSVMKMGNQLRIDSRIIEVETGIIAGAESRICQESLADIGKKVIEMTNGLANKYYRKH